MKIALITIWHEKNYGAELQAYATIAVLQQLGFQVEMIDIRLSDQNKKNLKNRLVNLIQYFTPSDHKFRQFWGKYIPITRRYRSLSDLQLNPPSADIYMVGSDQVWNPDITKKFYPVYFLDFGSEKIKKVSYASSFGVLSWNHSDKTDKVISLLKEFSHISCREKSGVEIIDKYFNLKANNVLDPTLLCDDYSQLIGSYVQKNTLVYYPLSKDPQLESFAKDLGKELHMEPVNINKKTYLLRNIVWDRPGIGEWVKSIAESRFVITRSFHGLAFSLIFKKQFAIIAVRNDRAIRVLDLLSLLGLENRFFSSVEDLKEKKPWETPIDYNQVSHRLNELRTQSMDCLIKMLKS